MENFQVIEFHRTRDFSQKMNATFEFIKQNIGPLTKSILYIAGPPVLIASVLAGSFMNVFFSSIATSGGDMTGLEDYFLSPNFWIQMLMMMVFLLVSGVMTIATINNYLLLYGEKRTNKIEVSEVWDCVRATFWMYFRSTIMFVVLFMLVYIAMIVPVVLLAAVSPWLIFLGVVLVFVGLFYVAFSASLTFIIRAYEKKGFFDSLARSFKLVQGKWWSTFGLLMILYLIMMTISYFFLIPWYVVTIVNTLHNTSVGVAPEQSSSMQVLTVVFFSLYYLAQMILNTLPNIGIAFQYFNLVELKEAKGLMNEINTLGQEQQPASQDEHY